MIATFLPLDFGPFRLLSPLGKGGIGEVFKAVHIERDQPVAIKILNARRARDPEFHTALRQEVRAVAKLHHPGLIMVFDYGEVDKTVEIKTKKRFITGASWLAMELASHSLQDLDRSSLDWWHIRNILIRILDALAHSHARGVIHRDLKPANVLFCDGPDGRQLKLTDFGLAHALDESPEDSFLAKKISGTPRFMAPEQIQGRWRDYGPWTDLYALGCLAYWLIDGEPPYRDGTTDQILESHLSAPLPPLHAPFDLPKGFGQWLGRMLAKHPEDRFQRAADAARALFDLGDPPGLIRHLEPPALQFKAALDKNYAPSNSGSDLGMTEIISDVVHAPPDLHFSALERPRTSASRQPLDRFVIPRTWHRKEPPPLSIDLVGVGLGLFGVRQIPFIGRHDERDRIWEALRQVARERKPQLVLLKGPTGSGKSRLASWISERAHELGAATPLRAPHSPMGGAHRGLPAMFADHLLCTGLSREEILARVRQSLHDQTLDPDALHDCLAMAELIAPAVIANYSEEQARIRFRSPRERHSVIFRYLQRLANPRPLIIILDDIHWSTNTLNALEYLLGAGMDAGLPILFLGTIQTDALVDRPLAREKIRALEAHPKTTSLPIGPLNPQDHRLLIKNMLGLEDQLVHEVAQRTGGNPLYAVQLVGDWVERHVLELGHRGFRLRRGEEAPLPDDLQTLFRDRLAKLVRHNINGSTSPTLIALELAAVLGTDVPTREWSALCASAEIDQPRQVLDDMIASDLAAITPEGWSFQHQAFRETLLQTAKDGRRLADHHLRAANTLRTLYGDDQPGLALRLSLHLDAAGQKAKALEFVLRAANQAQIRCDFELAHAQFQRYQRLLDDLGARPGDPQRARGWIDRARTLLRQDELAGADQLLQRAENTARTFQRTDLLAHTLVLRAIVASRRGQLPQGMTLVREAHELSRHLDDLYGQAQAYLTRADLHYWAGDYYDSERAYLKAHQIFSHLQQPLEIARVASDLGALYTILGKTDQAKELLEQARDVFQQHGDLRSVANCYNNLGELFREQKRLQDAEKAYQESHTIDRRLGLDEDIVTLINLGMVRLAQRRIEDAAPLFKRVLQLTATSQREGFLGLAHIANLPICAHREDWQRWDHHLKEGRHHLTTTGFVDSDIATLASDAGIRALLAGDPTRGRQALLLARAQWLSMGRQDRAAEIDRIMPPLPQT